MPDSVTIALDVMGGDDAPTMVLEGANAALSSSSRAAYAITFLLFGDETIIAPALEKFPKLRNACEIIHTDISISSDEKPSSALRKGRNSSMGLAIKSIKEDKAHAVVSCGNTGALMALSKILLSTLPGIDRPAIATLLPTMQDDCVMLDLGANVSCDANNLYDFAIMGDAFARIMLKKDNPSIALLNIGSEDMKGNDAVKSASEMIREGDLDLNFVGYVEGDGIGKGNVDVIVTDGFTGNVALKTAEGTAKLCYAVTKASIKRSLLGYIGAIFMIPAFKRVARKLDPRTHNGAMFLGLNGIVVKSHGGSDAKAFTNAIKVACTLAENRINDQIVDEMVQSGHIPEEPNQL